MLSRLLRKFLFAVVHLVVSVLVAGQNVYRRFWVKKRVFFSEEVTKSDVELILKHVPRMSKKLKHLVMMTDTDNQSLDELARVVIWSLVAGVPYVSFHDVTGELKQNEEKFFHEVEKKKKGIPGCIKWSKKPDLNGYSNGIQAHTVNVHIFTADDGRPFVAQCLRLIVEKKLPCERKSGAFTAQEFGDALSSMYPSIPDPELVLYTGAVCSTKGLLPWQIRLTEFIELSIDHSINVDNYVNALNKYNKCDQRFGK